MNINLNTSGLLNLAMYILIIIMLILTSACGQREHLKVTQAKEIYTKQYLHNCIVNDVVICDSIVTGGL